MKNVLNYPGSKRNIARQLVELIPPHHSYVEPYFGSGAVLFAKPPSAIETANDLDGDVVNLFRCIQRDSERLARLVMTTPFSREVYDRQFTPDNSCASRYQRAAGFLVRMWQSYGSRNRNDGYKEDDSMNDGEILFSNPADGYHLNINKEISMVTEDHAKQRKTDYVSYGIMDGNILTSRAHALLREAAKPSA